MYYTFNVTFSPLSYVHSLADNVYLCPYWANNDTLADEKHTNQYHTTWNSINLQDYHEKHKGNKWLLFQLTSSHVDTKVEHHSLNGHLTSWPRSNIALVNKLESYVTWSREMSHMWRIFNFEVSTPLSGHLNMLHLAANPRIRYLVAELWEI